MRDYLFKIVLAGGGGVGKTSLIRRYVKGLFEGNYKMTIGTDFLFKRLNINDKRVGLQIWDPGGQERFAFMRHALMDGAMGVIYLYDVTSPRSLHKLNDWIEANKKFNSTYENCQSILIGNKSDLYEKMGRVNEESVEYFNEQTGVDFKKHYLTSALTGDNVEKAFHDLSKLIVKNFIPESY